MDSSVLLLVLFSIIILMMAGGLLIIWTKMQKLQQAVQTHSTQESPSIGQARKDSQPIDVPFLGILNHSSSHASVSMSVGLAETWSNKGINTLVVETDPLRPIALRLNIKGLSQGQKSRVHESLAVVYLNPAQHDFEMQLAQALQGIDQVLLSLPSFSHPGFAQVFQKVNEYILTLELSTDSIKTLKGSFDLLKPYLDHQKQRFFGIQIVAYQEDNTNQQNLYKEIQKNHKDLLLVGPFSEEMNQDLISKRADELDKAIETRKTLITEPVQLVRS